MMNLTKKTAKEEYFFVHSLRHWSIFVCIVNNNNEIISIFFFLRRLNSCVQCSFGNWRVIYSHFFFFFVLFHVECLDSHCCIIVTYPKLEGGHSFLLIRMCNMLENTNDEHIDCIVDIVYSISFLIVDCWYSYLTSFIFDHMRLEENTYMTYH